MARHIYPTENSIGTFGGEPSRVLREIQLVPYLKMIGSSPKESFVYSGCGVQVGTGLNISINSGYMIINGFIVHFDAFEGDFLALPANDISYVYIQLTTSGGLVTGSTEGYSTAFGSIPSNALCIAKVDTGATGIDNIEDSVKKPLINYDTYVGNGDASRTIFLGYQPLFVVVSGIISVSSDEIYSIGGITEGATETGLRFDDDNTFDYIDGSGTVDHNSRPEIDTEGFIVGATAGTGLNRSGQTYKYIVFFGA